MFVACYKYFTLITIFFLDASDKAVSPPLVTQLTLLSRELVDLLKIQPGCQLAFGRFVPAYHHHFGRQIRVADYGFTKLIDLLEAIPNVVQVNVYVYTK